MVGFGGAGDNSAGMTSKSGLTFARGLRRVKIVINDGEFSEQPMQGVHAFHAEHRYAVHWEESLLKGA